jgi:EAL domain-containing protein (putative c-di-GMP-specific phosphodiesterase class I)
MAIPVSAPEFLLVTHMQNLGKRAIRQYAAVLSLSRTDPATKNNTQKWTQLRATISEVLGDATAAFFLSNHDVVLIAPNIPTSLLGQLLAKTSLIFGGDSFMSTIDRNNYHNLCSRFELAKDINTFNQYVAKHYNRMRQQSPPSSDTPLSLPIEDNDGISLKTLSDLERPLTSNDLSSITQRQDICLVDDDMKTMSVVMSETFVSMGQLMSSSMPNNKIFNERWLFLHLTSLLDTRVLAFLRSHDDPRFRSAVSINLNISSFFSSSFHNFDRILNPINRETIMFELQLVDIIADMEKFFQVRDALHERGYRFCIDSVPYTQLEYVDDTLFGLDMIKLNASGKLRSLDRSTLIKTVRRINELGAERFIFSRCDDSDTVLFGKKMHIELFQGHYIDNFRKKVMQKGEQKKEKEQAPQNRNLHPRAIRTR